MVNEIQSVYIFRKKGRKNWYGQINREGKVIWRGSLRTQDRSAAQAWKAQKTAAPWLPKSALVKETTAAAAIKAEREHLQVVYCELTRRTYESYLDTLAGHLAKNGLVQVHDFGAIQARAFLDILAGRMEPKSVRDRFRYYRRLYRQWVKAEYLAECPFDDIDPKKDLPKLERNEKPFWIPNEIEAIFDRAPSEEVRTFWASMYHAGLRFHEARWLAAAKLDLDAGDVLIRGKGGKLARVAMNSYLLPRLAELARRRPDGDLFQDVPRNEQGCLRQLRKAVAGISFKVAGPVTLHRFRHSCASNLLRAGENVISVAKVLRHSRASITVDTYSHVMRSDTQHAVARLAPANRFRVLKARRAG